MKISMWMLFDGMAAEIIRDNLDDRSKRICLKGVLPYLGPEYVSDGYLYVADATCDKQLRLPETVCYLALVGENFVAGEDDACQYIVLRPELPYARALSAAVGVFEKYGDWDAALQEELNGMQNLNRLCQLGSAMLENPTMLYDREYTIIAGDFVIRGDESDRYVKRDGPYYMLSAKAIRQLKSNAGFQQSFHQTGAAILRVDFLPYGVLYVNLNRNTTYEGRLCVTEDMRPFHNGDSQIAEILTEYIRVAVKRQAVRTSYESRKFEAFLLSILDGNKPGDDQVDSALQLWHWKRYGRYVCLRLALSELDFQTSSDLYILSNIAASLPGSCAVRRSEGITVVVSLGEKETADDVVDKLGRFFRDFIPAVGVSDSYRDFMQTAQYDKQALIAAEMGPQDKPHHWQHYFRNYAAAHYFRYGTSVLPAIHFCDADVRRLMAYQDSRTDYYNTLKTYLENNMNLLESAKALFIHRTTLFNRISRIRALISADLNNPEDRMRLMNSFELMEADKIYGKFQT